VVENLKRAVSWLVVFAVGLAPMLIYWVAELPDKPSGASAGVRGRVAGHSKPLGRGSDITDVRRLRLGEAVSRT